MGQAEKSGELKALEGLPLANAAGNGNEETHAPVAKPRRSAEAEQRPLPKKDAEKTEILTAPKSVKTRTTAKVSSAKAAPAAKAKKTTKTKSVAEAKVAEASATTTSVKKSEEPAIFPEVPAPTSEEIAAAERMTKREEEKRRRREAQRQLTQDFRLTQGMYEKIKHWAIQYERKNDSTLMLFRSKSDPKSGTMWWKMGGFSALFYYYKVSKRLKLEPHIKVDSDFKGGDKFFTGVISIQNMALFEKRMKSLKIYKDDVHSTKYITIFRLGYKVPREDIIALRDAEEAKLKKLNSVCEPKVIAPDVLNAMNMVTQILYNKLQKCSAIDREFILMDTARRMRGAVENYMLMAIGDMDMSRGFYRILQGVDMSLMDIEIMGNMKLLPADVCTRMADALVSARRVVMKRLNGPEDPEHEMAGDEMREKFKMSPKKNT